MSGETMPPQNDGIFETPVKKAANNVVWILPYW
jgi:hypothetical protein